MKSKKGQEVTAFIIFGCFVIVLIGLFIGIGTILKSNDNDAKKDDNPYSIMRMCETNIDTLDCKGLLECDRNCIKMSISSENNCHIKFTNYIIARCELHNAG